MTDLLFYSICCSIILEKSKNLLRCQNDTQDGDSAGDGAGDDKMRDEEEKACNIPSKTL